MRWILRGLIGLVLLGGLALAGFFLIAPAWVERDMNKVAGKPPFDRGIGPETQAFYDSLTLVDSHSDSLLWARNILTRSERGHVDVPRLQQANVALQVFSAVTFTPADLNYERNARAKDRLPLLMFAQLRPRKTWASIQARALHQAAQMKQAVAASDGQLKLILTAKDVRDLVAERAKGAQTIGALLALEGAHPMENSMDGLKTLYQAGYRMLGLVHFFDNEVAGSAHGITKGGLTPLGRQAVRWAEQKGMLIDLAHASPTTIEEVLAMATRPVLVSHTGVKGTCNNVRNLSDAQIRGIAATGGMIGVGYWDQAICDVSAEGIARAMVYVRDLVGARHVGLGSDFDGATTTPFDTTGLIRITQALLDAGVPRDEIRIMMGGAAMAMLIETLP